MEKQILFVYNAHSGRVQALLDMMHKMFSPNTYSCNLCAITYGYFGKKAEWRSFLNASKLSFIFLHKDEFVMQYPHIITEYPVAFVVDEQNHLSQLISTEMMRKITMPELILFLKNYEEKILLR